MDRETNQLMLPGIITENPDCEWEQNTQERVWGAYCDGGEVESDYGAVYTCPECGGTGKKYEEIKHE